MKWSADLLQYLPVEFFITNFFLYIVYLCCLEKRAIALLISRALEHMAASFLIAVKVTFSFLKLNVTHFMLYRKSSNWPPGGFSYSGFLHGGLFEEGPYSRGAWKFS